MKKRVLSVWAFAFLFLSLLSAKVQLPALFTDNMVLQQQSSAPIWGKAKAGKKVKVITSWDKKEYMVTVDANGQWKVAVQTPSAGGPYFITISDGQEIRLNNVMIGEVWICSGQSNMEMPLAGWGKVLNYEQEIAAANYPNIRLLHVEKQTSSQPENDLKVVAGGWQVCSPATIAEFSSVAYFFGRNLLQNQNVPIGLINTSWGGTIAEAWTSGESLEAMPCFRNAVKEIGSLSNEEQLSAYQQKSKDWNARVISADAGMANNKPVWADLGMNDSDWSGMSLPGFWEDNGLSNFDGIVWFRKTINIPEDWNNKELELHLGAVDDNDITYFNGVEIGRIEGWNLDRVYKIPASLVKKGKAVIAVRVTDTGGNGGIHGDAANMFIAGPNDNPKGKTTFSIANDWKYKVAVDLSKFERAPQSPLNNPNRPTVLYNAMIHPIVPYTIKGAIWYQGESNDARAYQYRELFPLMIQDWRKQWNIDFPFYFVQLANFMSLKNEPQESAWAELREAQMQTLRLENTGMAVSIDIGDAMDIHPKNKQEVGNRLALAARANTYGEKIPFSGPLYQSYQIENGKIRIRFANTNGGLKASDNKPLKGFAVAGSDHQFHWADAVIDGNDIVVSAPNVAFPVAVRYAWADNPECNLCNQAGLPASPFRTDDWLGITYNRN